MVETNGKVALAFVADRTASAQAGAARESVATTLSQTGKLIGNLLGGIDDKEKGAAPAPLNGSRPLVDAMPTTAADLAPVLKQALSQSGMFYEAHQARWVAGELPTALLLQEPQGQHSQAGTLAGELAAKANGQTATGGNALAQPASTLPGSENVRPEAHSTQVTQTGTAFYQQVMMNDATDSGSGRLEQTGPAVLSPQQGALPADLAPLVQQQLNALATQTFTWQGQIWPGQQMFWEIDDQQGNQGRGNEGTASQWQTRLKLNLPQLGGIDASLRLLPGNEIEISLSAAQGESGAKLDSFSQTLKQQLAAAGLKLTQFGVKNGSPAE